MRTIKRDIIICSMLLTGLTTLADNAADHIRGITPQDRRLVLMEEFTNQGCGPCAAFAPKFEHTVWSRLGDVVALTYHGNYPDGADKIYLANTSDVISRMNYYDITGVPTLLLNGQRVSTDADLDTCINICARDAATLDLQSTATLHDGVLGVAASVKPMTNLSGRSLRLYVAAVEEYVKYAQSTSNGENHWLYVMRKMLSDGDGQSLPATLLPDSTYSYHYQWTVSGYEDDRQLGIVVFVQDANTHDVLATQYVPRPSGTVSNAKILRVIDTPTHICSPRFTAVIPFRNTGADTLRSANITVNINGCIQTTAWQGALPPLGIDTVRTQPFTDFSLAQDGNNQVSISLTELNGTEAASLPVSVALTNAASARWAVRLSIVTDNKPEETTWTLYNSTGDVVEHGGPYTDKRHRYQHVFALDVDDCYRLVLHDTGHNGISGSAGNGYFSLHQIDQNGSAKLLSQQTFSTDSAEVYFSLSNADVSLDIDHPSTTNSSLPTYTTLNGTSVGNKPQQDGLYLVTDHQLTRKVVIKH